MRQTFEQCPAGTYNPTTGASSNASCRSCAAGTANPVPGSSSATVCVACLPGSHAAEEGTGVCPLCSDGQFQREYGQTACEGCIPGFYCKEGAAEPTPCPAGSYGNVTGLYSAGECTPVAIDFWAPLGSRVPEPCPTSGFYCPGALRDELYGGAKPIIMPVGQSTRQEEAPAVTQSMTLDISIDDFAAQREQLKIQLAAQYGVNSSLITLEAAAGSLQLTVTIATTDGRGNSVDLTTLEQAVAAVDDTALATTIGTVMNTTVTVTSQPAVTSTVRVTVPFACPRGKWCTAGLVVDCPLGTYNPLEDQDFATACIMCPLNSYTEHTNSTSRAACICDEGFYDVNASMVIDQDLINAMVAAGNDPEMKMAAVVDCQVCPVGTDCERGATLETLPLIAGYFRLDATTIDVRECPDARKNCSTTFGTDACESTSACIATGCAPGLTGVYCELCDRSAGLVYYTPSTDDNVATCELCRDRLASTLILIAIGLVVIVMVLVIGLFLGRRMPSTTISRMKYFNESFTPRNKFKIIMSFYQLATKVSSVYDVLLPRAVNIFFLTVEGFFSFGIDSPAISSTPLECMGLNGYTYKLIAYMVLPPAVIFVVVLAVFVSTCASKPKRTVVQLQFTSKDKEEDHGGGFHLKQSVEAEREPTFFEKTLPAVMTLLFLLYPLVTKVAFDGFPCYYFEDGTKGWLRKDVLLQCHAPDQRPMLLVWLAVGLYPIGITVFCGLLLLKASTAIIAGEETPLSRAISFLHREYVPTAFWWEIAEMVRKFLLVGLFVTIQPGSIMQIAVGTITCAVFLMVQLQTNPYRNRSDNYLAVSSSFSLLMVFFCSLIYKYDALTASDDVREKMSIEQRDDYIVNSTLLSAILFLSVLGALIASAVLVVVQIIMEVKANARLRRLKYAATGKWVECKALTDPQAFHLFLSHAWPAAQDRMRIVKARLLEALPSCKTFLDVDDLMSGSGTAEVDKSECILIFCTSQYFEKKNSLKELYRAVVQRRPILAMLEPDATQEGGLNQAAVEALITNAILDKFKLRKKWGEWKEDGELLPAAFDHAPGEIEVRLALFATPPVEWNRLPHFQDVTIRLIAQNGILHGTAGELYLQGEAATGKVSLAPPLKDREFHLFCSPFNAGSDVLAEELKQSSVFVTKGTKASAPLTYSTDVAKLAACDHMLVLLDERTWKSGEDTAKLVEHIHEAMRLGVHVNCVHEFPSVVGPPRHECEFGLMFGDDWTPSHLTGGPTNLYKEIALALKGVEWRQPGLVAIASKLASSAGPHRPINVNACVPRTYEPLRGANTWKNPYEDVAPILEYAVQPMHTVATVPNLQPPVAEANAAPPANLQPPVAEANDAPAALLFKELTGLAALAARFSPHAASPAPASALEA